MAPDFRLTAVAVSLLVCLPLAGCRSGADTSALERENRMLEDRIFELEDHADDLHRRLESTRRENDSLRRQAGGGSPATGNGLSAPQVEGLPELPSGGDDSVPTDGGLPQDSSVLEEAPRYTPSDDPAAAPDTGAPAPFEPVPDGPMPADPQQELLPEPPASDEPRMGELRQESTQEVARLSLNRRLSGGHDTADDPGDERLMVVIEPRDSDGQIVPAEGALSIAVVDPEQPGPAGRVARWDFTASETARHFRSTALGDGLHFDLPWPGQPPRNDRLRLHVQMRTADGRKLLASHDVRVDPPTPKVDAEMQPDVIPAAAADSKQVPTAPRLARPRWSPNR